MDTVFEDILRQFRENWRGLARTVEVWRPAVPVPDWMAPAVALGGLLSLVLLSGVAVLSVGLMLVALLAAYLILDYVFGLSLAIE